VQAVFGNVPIFTGVNLCDLINTIFIHKICLFTSGNNTSMLITFQLKQGFSLLKINQIHIFMPDF